MVIPPLREAPVFEATETETVPFPLPLLPDVMVTHESPLDAVHAQPCAAVTLTNALPPEALNDWLVGEME
jgi:hypothetical protein